MRRSILGKHGSLLLVFVAAGMLAGCGPGEIVEPASPVVSADSVAGKKAREQDEQFRALRRQQEAQAHRRMKELPEGE
ncbi:hypothetical protein SAMN05444166_3335 [Singulisphaera sp. GP187]|uniref:hypothetical protein n=1 Tax=Singulisphaera sp. GP187 TaxID=1882752 RepID=UPI00092AAA3A|nr:hypothetical protein [Singulisphaera sp. GP187]SIO26504.1 hypothetical protein SAMN05444166_3335 [Singulisphaera sp. GP187]